DRRRVRRRRCRLLRGGGRAVFLQGSRTCGEGSLTLAGTTRAGNRRERSPLIHMYPLGYSGRTEEKTMTLVHFMSSGTGRTVRVVLGVAMIAIGLILGGGWLALSVVGFAPLAAG